MNPPTNPSKTPASSPLDTEIRRAMGELANAAPPARPAESFTAESLRAGSTRPEFQPPRTSSSDQPSGQRGWLLAAAAAVVVAVVGVSLVLVNSDEPTTTISDVPPTPEHHPEAAVEPLVGDALLAEVAGRRWVALERFDDPSPTARTPEFTVTAAAGDPIVEGFDGSIELAPDASTLALVDPDGAQLARFHDLARLAPPRPTTCRTRSSPTTSRP